MISYDDEEQQQSRLLHEAALTNNVYARQHELLLKWTLFNHGLVRPSPCDRRVKERSAFPQRHRVKEEPVSLIQRHIKMEPASLPRSQCRCLLQPASTPDHFLCGKDGA